MVRGFALATVAFVIAAAPASAAPGFTSTFPVGDPGERPAMAADGTVVFPVSATIESVQRAAVRIRPPGGSVGAAQPLGGTTATPAIVKASAGGRVVAAWVESGDVEVATLMPGASSFGPPTTLPPQSDTADSGGLSLAVDATGNAIV